MATRSFNPPHVDLMQVDPLADITGPPIKAGNRDVPIIRILLEIAERTPAILLEQLLAKRILLHSSHHSSWPVVLKMGAANADGTPPPVGMMLGSWPTTSTARYWPILKEENGFAVVRPDKDTPLIASLNMSDFRSPDPSMRDAAEWWNLDLQEMMNGGHPILTLADHGAVRDEWVKAVAEVFSSSLDEALRGFEATPVELDDTITPAGFREALYGFPDRFVEAVCTLAGEIDHLVGHIAAVAGSSREEKEFELCDEISKACILALVPGIRALAFHGFGWPVLSPQDAKNFLRKIREVQPVSVETIASLSGNLDSEQREKLLSFLLRAGLVSMKDSLISVVEPADFLAAQFVTHAPEGNADRTEFLA